MMSSIRSVLSLSNTRSIDMARPALVRARTTVNIGSKTTAAAEKICDVLNLGTVSNTVRMGVLVLDALCTAEELGYNIEMVNARGVRFDYTLLFPKQIKRSAARGRADAAGDVVVLVATDEQRSVTRSQSRARAGARPDDVVVQLRQATRRTTRSGRSGGRVT
jgi:hypothetical protein